MMRVMICAGYVASLGKNRKCTRFWWGNLKEEDIFDNLGMDRKIILK
jgi:hypothetical protein